MSYLNTAIIANDAGLVQLAERAMDEKEITVGRELAWQFKHLLASPDPIAAKEAMILLYCGSTAIPPYNVRLSYFRSDQPGMAKTSDIPEEIRVLRPDGKHIKLAWRPIKRREAEHLKEWAN